MLRASDVDQEVPQGAAHARHMDVPRDPTGFSARCSRNAG
jgi:hypothetical protein